MSKLEDGNTSDLYIKGVEYDQLIFVNAYVTKNNVLNETKNSGNISNIVAHQIELIANNDGVYLITLKNGDIVSTTHHFGYVKNKSIVVYNPHNPIRIEKDKDAGLIIIPSA